MSMQAKLVTIYYIVICYILSEEIQGFLVSLDMLFPSFL